MYWDNKRDAPVSQIIGRTSATKPAQPVSPFNPIILSNCILGFLIRVRVSGSLGSGFLMQVRVQASCDQGFASGLGFGAHVVQGFSCGLGFRAQGSCGLGFGAHAAQGLRLMRTSQCIGITSATHRYHKLLGEQARRSLPSLSHLLTPSSFPTAFQGFSSGLGFRAHLVQGFSCELGFRPSVIRVSQAGY